MSKLRVILAAGRAYRHPRKQENVTSSKSQTLLWTNKRLGNPKIEENTLEFFYKMEH